MASRTNVPAAVVRAWGLENLDSLPDAAKVSAQAKQGRLNPALVEAFRKDNPKSTYAEGVAEVPTITVPYVALDKTGRRRQAKVTLTHAAARVVLGQPTNRRGRIALGDLSLAVEAHVLAGVALPE